MIELYDFSNKSSDIRSLIHIIGLMGDNITGLELGVETGNSFMTLLHNCLNIKTLHGVDNFEPYDDCLGEPYISEPVYSVDQKQVELNKSVFYNRIKYSGMEHKIVFHELDSNEALNEFEPDSLDFIFIDTYMNYQQAQNDIKSWYPMVRGGGLFSGHDWDSSAVQKALTEFRLENKIDSRLSTYDNCWCWIK